MLKGPFPIWIIFMDRYQFRPHCCRTQFAIVQLHISQHLSLSLSPPAQEGFEIRHKIQAPERERVQLVWQKGRFRVDLSADI
jgi:hypothetical protein